MAMNYVVRARRLLALVLACWLLAGGYERVQATATSDQIGYITQFYRLFVTQGAVSPLQGAISESNAIDCINKLPSPDNSAVIRCTWQQLPAGAQPGAELLATVVYNYRFYMPGAWATRAIYQGEAADGTMTVDKNNVGTLSSGSGTATLIFSKYDDPNGSTYMVFAYRTAAGDRGSGVLFPSVDGCLLYGPYHSTDDPKTIGNFLMARC